MALLEKELGPVASARPRLRVVHDATEVTQGDTNVSNHDTYNPREFRRKYG